MSLQKLIEKFLIECPGVDLGNTAPPPIGFGLVVLKTDTAKLPRVGEDERAFSLMQDEMIVFARSKVWRLNMRLAGHPEMNTEPIAPGKLEEHLLSPP